MSTAIGKAILSILFSFVLFFACMAVINHFMDSKPFELMLKQPDLYIQSAVFAILFYFLSIWITRKKEQA